ncbi:MAG: beta-ketoacyl-ACP synthase III [Acidimicrobiia bacterium]
MSGAAIAGWGFAVPEQRVANADLEARLNTSDAWITERTGIKERRWAGPDESTATLATDAGFAAIKHAGLTPADIDLLIVATCSSETTIPHTGAWVSANLGLECGSFDLNAACAGFVYATVVADALMQTQGLRNVLVIGSEVLSRFTDPNDRGTAILFGDAAAAVVLQPGDTNNLGLLAAELGCDGTAASILYVPAGGSRRPASAETVAAGEHFLQMNGKEVFRRAVRVVIESAEAAMQKAGVTADQIDWFVPHQANVRIIESACQRLGIPEARTIVNLDQYGNTSAASIPLALAEAVEAGQITDGDLILMSGFGAGMTWASALLRWGAPTGKANP